MAAYLTLIKFTDQGVRNVKDTVNRGKAAQQALAAAGGRFIGIWWALGRYDVAAIVEAPNEETVMRFLLATGMQGNIRTETLQIFSEEEMERIVQGLP
jgi:uncharacterized protein with GYD domain